MRRSTILAWASVLAALCMGTTEMVVRAKAISGSGEYYTRETFAEDVTDYLASEGAAEWFGPGLEHLGLRSGEGVDRDTFRRLLEGVGPDGRKLAQSFGPEAKRSRQPGTDLVFSTAKYFDVIYALAPEPLRQELESIFRDGIKFVLDFAAREFAWARRGKAGRDWEHALSVFALFHHTTNRLEQCHRHTHACLPNVCVRVDGTTGTIQSKPFYLGQRTCSALFDLYVSTRLQALGFTVRKVGWTYQIVGIPRTLARAWSGRKQQIDAELNRTGNRTFDGAEEAARKTRTPKRHLPTKELRERWASEAKRLGFDIDRLLGQLPLHAARDRKPSDILAATSFVREVTEALAAKGKTFTKSELIAQAAFRGLAGAIGPQSLLAAVDHVLRTPQDFGLDVVKTRRQEPVYAVRGAARPEPSPVSEKRPAATNRDQPTSPDQKTPPGRKGAERPAGDQDPDTPKQTVETERKKTQPIEPGGVRDGRKVDAAPATGGHDDKGRRREPKPGRDRPSPVVGQLPERVTPPSGRKPVSPQTVKNPVRFLSDQVRAWFAVRRAAGRMVDRYGKVTTHDLERVIPTLGQKARLLQKALAAAASGIARYPRLNGLVPIGRGKGIKALTTVGHKRIESRFARDVDALARRRGPGIKGHVIKRALGRLSERDENFRVAFRELATQRSRLVVVDSPSGDDRVALVSALARACRESGLRDRWVAPGAPAAAAIARKTKAQAKSLSSFLGDVEKTPIGRVLGWMHRHEFPSLRAKLKAAERVRRPFDALTRRDVVFLDQAQAADTRSFGRLAHACRKSGARLVVIGSRQEPSPLMAGGGWQFLAGRYPTVRYDPPRQAPGPERDAARLVREGLATKAVERLDRAGRLFSAADGAGAMSELLARYKEAGGLEQPIRHKVVTTRAKDVDRLNAKIQAERRRAGLLGLASVRVGPATRVRAGDRVVFTRRVPGQPVTPGQAGTVASVNPALRTVTVRTDQGLDVTAAAGRRPCLKLGYAETVHAQAAEVAHLYALVLGPWFSREAANVVLSRALYRLELFTDREPQELAYMMSQGERKTLAIQGQIDRERHQRQGIDR